MYMKGRMSVAEVVAVNISERKGIRKHEVPYIELLPHHGIVGDAMRATGTGR